jgi:transcriptional regulator GlxA family with amidase domain
MRKLSPDGCLRTQQVRWKRVFGIGYRSFLRIERLDAARDALRSPMRGETVTTIAIAFGFTELGRFSVIYRELFGEVPSATLGRAKKNGGTEAPPSVVTRRPW